MIINVLDANGIPILCHLEFYTPIEEPSSIILKWAQHLFTIMTQQSFSQTLLLNSVFLFGYTRHDIQSVSTIIHWLEEELGNDVRFLEFLFLKTKSTFLVKLFHLDLIHPRIPRGRFHIRLVVLVPYLRGVLARQDLAARSGDLAGKEIKFCHYPAISSLHSLPGEGILS